MTIKSIAGIDHAVVAVRDLDAAAANWKQLGFTISPRGTHSAHMGTGNYTIMLGDDYMELLGVLDATEHNAPTRNYLEATGGGIERVAFTTPSAAAGAAEIRTLGYAAIGPTDFERPVTMPDGRKAAAKFATFQWPVKEAPGGVRLFACQHKTRDTVWIPELQKHANTANRIARVFIVTPSAADDAKHLAKMIAGEVQIGADGSAVVPTGFRPRRFRLPQPRCAGTDVSGRGCQRACPHAPAPGLSLSSTISPQPSARLAPKPSPAAARSWCRRPRPTA